MEAKTYDINDLQNRRLFYMLDNITDESVRLFRRTPAGDEEYTHYSLHRMPDGKLLIAFFDHWSNPTIHSLIAKFNGQEEFVNIQPFERIMPYWNPTSDYENKGAFLFANSKPIYVDPNDWRCDNTFYGPERYVTPDGIFLYPQIKPEQVVVYEPIININGIANLMFFSTTEESYTKNYAINEDIIPSTAITLSEMFRLITEWATLAEAPFNSTEPIVLDAKEFLNKIEFDSSLVADQTNMQVAQFFLGNTDARRRPTDVVETNQDLLDFVKRKMAHMSLASLMSCYPEYGKIDAEIQFDIESAYKQFDDDLKSSQTLFEGLLDDYETALQFAPGNHKLRFTLKWPVLKRSKDLALSLMSNQ
jgi:hypothetical protein